MRRAVVLIGALAVLLVGGVAYAAIPDEDGYTYICVNKGDGSIRAREKGATCPKNFTPSRLVANQNAVPTTTTYEVTDQIQFGGGGLSQSVVANCDDGDVLTGGGHQVSKLPATVVDLDDSRPATEGEGWVVGARNHGATTITLSAYAICQHTE